MRNFAQNVERIIT